MPDAAYSNLRRRLRRALRAGYTVQFAVRKELARAGRHPRPVALAMLAAALQMPDAFRGNLNTCPTLLDVSRGVLKVGDVVMVVRRESSLSGGSGRPRGMVVLIQHPRRRRKRDEPCATELADFIGLSVLLRAGGIRGNALKWVALIMRP